MGNGSVRSRIRVTTRVLVLYTFVQEKWNAESLIVVAAALAPGSCVLQRHILDAPPAQCLAKHTSSRKRNCTTMAPRKFAHQPCSFMHAFRHPRTCCPVPQPDSSASKRGTAPASRASTWPAVSAVRACSANTASTDSAVLPGAETAEAPVHGRERKLNLCLKMNSHGQQRRHFKHCQRSAALS